MRIFRKTAFLPAVTLALVCFIALFALPIAAQFDPGEHPVRILEILNIFHERIATVVVPAESDRAYEAGREYWRFSEESLAAIAEEELLEIEVLAEGAWDDSEVVEALAWRPEGDAVEWNHPSEADWIPQSEEPAPELPEGTYFGNSTLGGLAIQYTPEGDSSLLWIKLTEGPFMELEGGAKFHQEPEVPEDGSWWQGEIEG